MKAVGYGFLHQKMELSVFHPRLPARIESVLRVIKQADHLAVPTGVAPGPQASHLEHVLFALKHEGINLQILAAVLTSIPEPKILEAIQTSPGGIYVRKACFLWEHFNQKEIADAPAVTGAVNGLFDPLEYLTCLGPTSKRWRIQFNGFGSLNYCPVVRRTPEIEQFLNLELFNRIYELSQTAEPSILDRAMAWAYLGETDGSFAIEGEQASPSKRERFVQLLRRAHEGRIIDEVYLIELQNATIDNPFDKAVQFRAEQNRLVNGRVVTYLPPPPELGVELMGHMMQMANEAPKKTHPLVAAALSSFGFVFLHPFMDGNGRISRFLFHKALCDSGKLPTGLILPVSVAMKKHEEKYLHALQSYSRDTRDFWVVGNLGNGEYLETFNGSPEIYRYWDATECVEFGFSMAQEALECHLLDELETLKVYDSIKKEIDAVFDIRGDKLSMLIFACINHGGELSKNLRKKFVNEPAGLLDCIERLVTEHLVSRDTQVAQAPQPI